MTQIRVTIEEDEIEHILIALDEYRNSSVGKLKENLRKYVDKWADIHLKYWERY